MPRVRAAQRRRERLAPSQAVLDLAVAALAGSEPLRLTSSQDDASVERILRGPPQSGSESASQGDNLFRDLALIRSS